MFQQYDYLLRNYEILLIPIGILATCYFLFVIAIVSYNFILTHVVSRLFPFSVRNYGQWAIITGGSSGIGRSYAFELAKRGMNLIIVSNELEALKSTAESIETQHGVNCRYIYGDLTEGNGIRQRFKEELDGKDVGILINCAGIVGNLPRSFLRVTEKDTLTMIDLHITAVVQITHLVLPYMLAKNRGAIITISSFSSLLPFYKLNIYSASKAYSDRFTRAVAWEYNKKGIYMQSLIPYFVSTRLLTNYKRNCMIPDSECFVRNAVPTLKFSGYTTGYWKHEMLRYFIQIIIWVYPNILRERKI